MKDYFGYQEKVVIVTGASSGMGKATAEILVDLGAKVYALDWNACDVKDIEKVYETINQAGLNTTNDIVHFLPFWENGVKFFTIEGPNKEKVEFSQYL